MRKFIFLVLPLLWCILQAAAQTSTQSRLLEDLKTLASAEFEGRRSGTEGAEKARRFIRQRFTQIGLQPAFGKTYEQLFEIKTRKGERLQGVNLAGVIRGTKNNSLWIVVSAHYDHLGKIGNDIFFGADDNASGVAALLALAERFVKNPPRHNMLFLATDGEEIGLQGARHFTAHLPFAEKQLALNVNMDMVSRSDKNELFAAGTYHYPILKKILSQYVPQGFKLSFGHDSPQGQTGDDWSNASDHAPFHQKGIPFVYFGVEDHEDYHKPTDTFERIHPRFFAAAVTGIGDCLQLLDQNLNAVYKQKSER